MTWVAEKVRQHRKVQADHAQILKDAEVLFAELWQEITERLKEAEEYGWHTDTNGTAFERTVTYRGNYISIDLCRADHEIRVDGSFRLEFSIEVCPDGVICLTHEAKQVPLTEAARLILEPLLFFAG